MLVMICKRQAQGNPAQLLVQRGALLHAQLAAFVNFKADMKRDSRPATFG